MQNWFVCCTFALYLSHSCFSWVPQQFALVTCIAGVPFSCPCVRVVGVIYLHGTCTISLALELVVGVNIDLYFRSY